MNESPDMLASALKRDVQPSLRDNLSHSGFTPEQAQTIERAVANLHHFIPSYWIHEFTSSGLSEDQALLLVDLFSKRSS